MSERRAQSRPDATRPLQPAPLRVPRGTPRIAIEPRMLFDGAAVATLVATVTAPPAEGAAHGGNPGGAPTHAGDAPPAAATEGAHDAHDAHPNVQDAPHAEPLAPLESAPSSSASHTVVFIDSSLDHVDQLIAAAPAGARIVMLDPTHDGLQQMADALVGTSGIQAIHLVTHGDVGQVEVGSTTLDAQAIEQDRTGLLAEIGKHLAVGADVLVYGCDFGAGPTGAAATEALSHALHADVAASENDTGATSLHGDWVLERHVGDIHAQAIDGAGWDGLLLNLPPVATPDVALVRMNGSINVNVVGNDIDPNGDPITLTGASALHGSVVVNANNTLTYTPTTNYFGVDTISYTIRDSHGASALLPGLVAVTIDPLPTLTVPLVPVFPEDTPIVFAGLLGTGLSVGNLNGSLVNLDLAVPIGTLTLAQTAGLTFSHGTGTNDTNITIQGSVAAINAALNGLVYTPAADYNGPVNLTIGISDTVITAMVATILPISVAPVADIVADNITTTLNHSASFNVLANDTFENAGRVVSGHTAPSHGTVTIDAQGNTIYTPTAGYLGNDTFNYTVTSNGTTETTTVTIAVVVPVNHAPVGTALPAVSANDAQVVSIAAGPAFTDVDGDTLTYSATGLPSGVTINAATGVISGTLGGHASVAVPGGAYAIVVTANDGHGGTASQGFTLTAVNPAPTAVDDVAAGVQNGVIVGNVLTNDSDPDGDTLRIATTPVSGPAHGNVVLNANGSYLYTPTAGYFGADSFTYRVIDADGGTSTAVVSLTIASPVNHPPLALPDVAFVNQNGSVTINVLANDVDLDGDRLSVTSATALHGTVVRNGDGTLTYTPTAGFAGVDVITYGLQDAQGGNALLPGTVAVTVNALPTLRLPTLGVTYEDTPIVFSSILGTQLSIGDLDGTVARLTLSVPVGTLTLAQTAGLVFTHGTGTNDTSLTIQGPIADINAALNGLIYTPGADYNGPLNLSIGFNDTLLTADIVAVVPLYIVPVDDIVADTVTTIEGQAVSFNVLANDTFENVGRVVSGHTAPSHGSLTIDAQGNATYTPSSSYLGNDSFSYTVTSNGTTETNTVTIAVNAPPNHAPVAGSLVNIAADDGQPVSIGAGTRFTDADGDPLTFGATGLPPGLSIDATTGVISGTLDGHASVGGNAGTPGVYTVIVTANDGNGGSVSQAFTFTASNPAPLAAADTVTGPQDGPLSGNVLSNDSDPDGDALHVATTPVVAPLHGSLALNADGSFVYTPASGYHGADGFTYLLIDADGGSATAVVTLNVNAVNHAPTSTPLAAASGNDAAAVSIATATNFADGDGDALTFSATGLPTGLTIDAATGVISGTLDGHASVGGNAGAGNPGVYNIVVTASDGNGGTVSQGFAFTAVNPAPIAVADNITVNQGGGITGNVLANDSDPDGDALHVSTTPVVAPTHGSLALNADGTFVYTPTAGFRGTDQFTYQVVDADGGVATATVTLTVNGNHAPTSTPIGAGTGNDAATVSITTASHFADGDGDTLTYSATGLPAGLAIDATTGVISGTLGGHASVGGANPAPGVYDIVVTASDGNGGTVSETLRFTAVNPAPIAVADSVSGNQGGPITGNVLANDSDPDGDALQVSTTPVVGPSHGSLTLNPDGTFVYTPVGGYQGIDGFTYQLVDADGGTSTASVTLTVTSNHAPTSTPIAAASGNDAAVVSIATATNFADSDGDALTFSATGLPTGLTIDAATGVISGTLDGHASVGGNAGAGNQGVYNIVVTASDGNGGTVSQGFAFTAVNPAPVAVADTVAGPQDTALSGNVLANDSDPDGDALHVSTTPVAGPLHGSLTLSADGSFVYTPTAGYRGTDSFTYRLVDADGGTATAVVTLNVTAVNHGPTSTPIAAATGNDAATVSLATAANFADADGDPLTFSATGLPAGLAIDATTGVISGTLDGHASVGNNGGGAYSIVVTASDGNGGTASQAFAFTAVNPAPNAVADSVSGNQGQALTGNVLANDSDPDGDALSVATTPVVAPGHGSLTLNADGSFVYTPTPGYQGTDSFTYRLIDADGGVATASVTLNVTSNHAPASTPLGTATASDAAVVSIATASNFVDADGDALTYSATGLPAGLTIDATTGVIGGTLDGHASVGSSVGNPNGVYDIVVTADDGNGGTTSQTLRFTATNPAPTAVADSLSGNQGDTITGNVLTNDSDPDGDALQVSTTPVAGPAHGSLTLNANGTFVYTPTAGYQGNDSFTYRLVDADGGTATASVALTITGNHAPTSTPIGAATGNDAANVSIATATHFADSDGDPLTFSATGLPAGLAIDATSGVISGTLDGHASVGGNRGSYDIVVTASDGHGGSVSQTFAFTAVNPAPNAVADSVTGNQGATLSGNVLGNDNDPDGDALGVSTTPVVAPAHGSLTLNTDGSFVYTPVAGYHGTDSFTYRLVDADGGTSTAIVALNVTAFNHGPTSTPIAAATGNDAGVVSVATASSFSDVDGDALTFSATGLPAGLVIDPTTGVIGGTLDGHASVGGTNPANPGVYDIVVTANDGNGGTVSQGFAFTAVNPAPGAVADAVTGQQGGTITGNVLTNDSDADGDALRVVTTPVVGPAHGSLTLNADGSFVYNPLAGYHGTDSFTYRLVDADGGTSTAVVTLDVTAFNHAPTSTPIAAGSGDDGTPVSIATAGHFSDVDADALTFSATGLPNGLAIDATTGVISGTLDGHASVGGTNGVYSVVVTADDGHGGTVSQTLQFTATNPAPTARADSISGNQGGPITGNVLINDSDPDGDALHVSTTPVVAPTHGSLTLNADGTFVYTPAAGYHGNDSFTYQLIDADGGTATATVMLSFTSNHAPTATPIPAATGDDQTRIDIATASHFSDVDGNALTYSATGLPAGLTIDAVTGIVSGTLDRHASAGGTGSGNPGVYDIVVTANDGNGGFVSQHLSFTATNPAPIAVDDTAIGNQGAPLTGNVLANDSDPDGDALQVSTTPVVAPTHGSLTLNADGSFVYMPVAGYQGSDSFTYRLTDADGGTTTASVTLTVSGNHAPTATPIAAGTGDDAAVVTFATASHFADSDGDTLTFSATGLPAGLSIDAATGVIGGTLDGHASVGGTNATPGVYDIVVTANDGNGGFVSQHLSFTATNPAPIAVDDTAIGNQGAPLTGNVLANDSDPDGDALQVSTTPVVAPTHGSLTLNADGSFVYTPVAGYQGNDSFTYRLTDADGGTTTASVTLTVSGNHAPTATPIAAGTGDDAAVVTFPTASHFADSDGDTLTFSATGLPAGLSIDAATGVIGGTLDGHASVGGTNATPGVYDIVVTANDGNGGTASQRFAFTATNPAPIAGADTFDGPRGGPLSGNVLTNDSDVDGDALHVSTTPVVAPSHGSVVLNADGTFVYTPLPGYEGADRFTYRLVDADGGTATASVSLTIAANRAPTSTPIDGGTADDAANVSLPTATHFGDSDGDTLTYSATGLPAGLAIDATTGIISGTLDGHASVGGPNAAAPGSYAIVVTASDGNGGTTAQSFVFTAVNPAPNAVGDTVGVARDGSTSGNVLANDSDPDGDALQVSTTPVFGPSHGSLTLNGDGSFVYTPAAGYHGSDSFAYRLVDADGGTATATVTVAVGAPNQVPTPTPIPDGTHNDGNVVSIPTAPGFRDPDGDPLTYGATGLPPGLTIDPTTGVIGGTLDGHASAGGPGGVYDIVVTASDGHGGSTSQGFTFTATNTAPVALDPTVAVGGPTVTGNLFAAVRDADGDALTIDRVPVSAPAHGTVTIDGNGRYVYTPAPQFSGNDAFSYRVTDSDGTSVVVSVNLVVTATAAPTPSPTPTTPEAPTPVALLPNVFDGPRDGFGGTDVRIAPEQDLQTQVDARSFAYDTVILKVIDGVRNLNAQNDIASNMPLGAVVSAESQLGGRSELAVGAHPMGQVVGDLSAGFRQTFSIDSLASAGASSNAPGTFAASDAGSVVPAPTVEPVVEPEAPARPIATRGDAAGDDEDRAPITLTAQLRTATLQATRDLQELADALH